MDTPFKEIHIDIVETKNRVGDIEDALPEIKERQYLHGQRLRKHSDQLDGQHEHLSRLQRTVMDVAESRRFTYIPKPYFQPRTGLWAVLERRLSVEGPTLPVVLVGLGGMGKTSVATEWTNKQKTSGKYHSIRRMLMDKLSIENSLHDLAHDLYIETDKREREDWLRDIAQRFQAQSWLMLWDNVESYSTLEEILPYFTSTKSTQQLLITSRDTTGWQEPIMVDTFTPEESIAYIQHQMTAAGSSWFKKDQAKKLAECFDHHPLALELAMGTVCLYQRPLEQYLKELEDAGLTTLKAPDKKLASQARINTNKLTTLWQMGLANLPGDAISLLQVMSFIDVDGVGRDLMAHYFSSDQERCDEALLALRQQAFIKFAINDAFETWGTHRLLQEVVRDEFIQTLGQEAELWSGFLDHSWTAIAEVFPSDIKAATDTASVARCVTYGCSFLNHMQSISTTWTATMKADCLLPWQAKLLPKVGNGERLLSRYNVAKETLSTALKTYYTIHGATSNHPDIARILDDLGLVYKDLGNCARAIEFFEKSLDINSPWAKTPNYVTIAVTMNNLGLAYQAQGNLARAIEFYEQSLKMHRTVYVTTPNHHNIATTLNNLGFAYRAQGNNSRAIELYEESLAMHRLVYATTPNHPNIAMTLGNLGVAYQAQGNNLRAIEFYNESLAMQRLVYAKTPNHLEIANTLSNLGAAYKALDNNRRAIELFEESLVMYRVIYAATPNHSFIADTLNNLGSAYQDQDNHARAIALFEESLAMYSVIYAATPNRTDIAATLNTLGFLYQSQGNHARAIAKFEASLAMYRIIYAATPNRPVIAATLMCLANEHQAEGNNTRAISLYEESLAMHRLVYATTPNHIGIITILNILGDWHQARGNDLRAIQHFEELLAMQRIVYSTLPNQSNIAWTLRKLGDSYQNQGNNKRAIELYKESLEMYRLIYATTPNHPVIAATLNNLGFAHKAQGNNKRAIEFYEASLVIFRVVYTENPNHPDITNTLNNLNSARKAQENQSRAETMNNTAVKHGNHRNVLLAKPPRLETQGHTNETNRKCCSIM